MTEHLLVSVLHAHHGLFAVMSPKVAHKVEKSLLQRLGLGKVLVGHVSGGHRGLVQMAKASLRKEENKQLLYCIFEFPRFHFMK